MKGGHSLCHVAHHSSGDLITAVFGLYLSLSFFAAAAAAAVAVGTTAIDHYLLHKHKKLPRQNARAAFYSLYQFQIKSFQRIRVKINGLRFLREFLS
jgi:hypothetical protein